MSTITVSSSTALNAALNVVQAGDTILLKAGNYGALTVRSLDIAGKVTIASADPSNQAVITDLQMYDCSGLTFQNVSFHSVAGVSTNQGVVGVFNSENINFDHVYVHGSLNNDSADDGHGIRIKSSTNVTVTNSEFEQLFQAVGFGDSSKVTITGNNVHDIRQDGIRGGGTSDLTIANNYLTNFHKVGTEHTDAIQIYPGNILATATNIRIEGNVVYQGTGTEVQGIFLRDPEGGLSNVQIANNLVVGSNYNGIAVEGAKSLSVTGNTVVAMAGESNWISVQLSPGAIVSNNEALQFLSDGSAIQSDNKINVTASDPLLVLRGWLASHPEVALKLPADALPIGVDAVTVEAVVTSGSRMLVGGETTLTLTGTANVDGGGNELDNVITGNVGDNKIRAYGGNDTIEGGAGTDLVDGGDGNDTASYEHAGAGVVISLIRWNGESISGVAQETYGAGKDTLVSIENVTGSAYNDTLTGDNGANVLKGGGGADKFQGTEGADTMVGGAGADTFFYNGLTQSTVGLSGRDKIADFNGAEGDIIDLKRLDAMEGLTGDQKFTLVTAFTKAQGQLTVTYETNHYVVRGDVNGDGAADFAIDVYSTKALVSSDFIF